MGDYQLEFLNKEERQFHDTFTIPDGLNVTETEFRTRVQGNSMSFFECIITDLPQIEKFQTVVLDTLLQTLYGKEIDHYATSLISTITKQHRSKNLIRKIFDETNYIVQMFQQLINDSGWGNFYKQDCAEGMITVFSIIIESAMKKCAPKKTVFILTEKSIIAVKQTWVIEESRKLFRQINSGMNPKLMKDQIVQ